jgi:hypothetical protein
MLLRIAVDHGMVQLDANPRMMVLIAFSVGVFGVGVILLATCWNTQALLGLGIGLAILGIAGVIGTCFFLQASVHDNSGQDFSGSPLDKPLHASKSLSVAPRRVPQWRQLTYRDGNIVGESDDDEDDGALVYAPCSVSPARVDTVRGGVSAATWSHQRAVTGASYMSVTPIGSASHNGSRWTTDTFVTQQAQQPSTTSPSAGYGSGYYASPTAGAQHFGTERGPLHGQQHQGSRPIVTTISTTVVC